MMLEKSPVRYTANTRFEDTLACEGIGVFIVVGYEYPLVGLEVFSFQEAPWSVIYGILSL